MERGGCMAVVSSKSLVEELERELHELCQPLTALQCRLELSRMVGDRMVLLEAIEESLTETRRMFLGIARMRERLRREDGQDKGIEGHE